MAKVTRAQHCVIELPEKTDVHGNVRRYDACEEAMYYCHFCGGPVGVEKMRCYSCGAKYRASDSLVRDVARSVVLDRLHKQRVQAIREAGRLLAAEKAAEEARAAVLFGAARIAKKAVREHRASIELVRWWVDGRPTAELELRVFDRIIDQAYWYSYSEGQYRPRDAYLYWSREDSEFAASCELPSCFEILGLENEATEYFGRYSPLGARERRLSIFERLERLARKEMS